MRLDKIQNVPIEQLVPYEKNNKIHNEDQIKKIARSIKEIGFRTPIQVDENRVILAGHGRLEGAKRAKLKEVPVNRGIHTDKSYCLPANPMSDRGQIVLEMPCGTQYSSSENFGNSFGSQKAYTLRASCPNGVIENIGVVRKLTPIECERLQTLPDNYTEGVSDSQRYKMLGNGWTVDVISHIFSYIPK